MPDDHVVSMPPIDGPKRRALLELREQERIARETKGRDHVAAPRTGKLVVDTRVIVPRANRVVDPTVTLTTIPNLSVSIGSTHDMSQYINGALERVASSEIVGLNTALATYSHSTKLLTGVAAAQLVVRNLG